MKYDPDMLFDVLEKGNLIVTQSELVEFLIYCYDIIEHVLTIKEIGYIFYGYKFIGSILRNKNIDILIEISESYCWYTDIQVCGLINYNFKYYKCWSSVERIIGSPTYINEKLKKIKKVSFNKIIEKYSSLKTIIYVNSNNKLHNKSIEKIKEHVHFIEKVKNN